MLTLNSGVSELKVLLTKYYGPKKYNTNFYLKSLLLLQVCSSILKFFYYQSGGLPRSKAGNLLGFHMVNQFVL